MEGKNKMKIKDKTIKLHLLNKLETYDHDTKIGEIEHNKLELQKDNIRLFIYLTVIGLIFSIIKSQDLLILFLLIVLISEFLYIQFIQNRYIKIHNDIIKEYQKRSVGKDYIDMLLKEINEEWDLKWDRLHPIVTKSMFKEGEKRTKQNIEQFGKKIENKPSINYICKHLKDMYNKKKIVQIKGYVKWSGWQFAKEIKSQKLLGFLRRNIYIFTRINIIYDKSGYVDLYDFFPLKSFRYPKHIWPPSWIEGVYNIKAEIIKQNNFYYLHVIEKELLKNKSRNK